MIDEAKFFAWLDGELSDTEAEEVERQVAADESLQRQADEHRQLTAGLRDAFSLVSNAPPPSRLTDLVTPRAAEIVSLAEARERRTQRIAPPLWKQLSAIAATLALGIFAGDQLARSPAGPVEAKAGRLVASAPLAAALTVRLASAPTDEGPRIGMTFRDRSGAICRTFEDQAASGLACRDEGDWRIRGLFPSSDTQQGDYRMAAGMDPELMALVDKHMNGEAFDANEERSAQNEGWR